MIPLPALPAGLDLQDLMLIAWSDEENAYLVTLPDWADRVAMPVTHGATYDEAVHNGREALLLLIRGARCGESGPDRA